MARATGMLHYARLDGSPRLQRVLQVLSDGRKHTTRDLIRRANVCAVNSCASELRANGIAVNCRQRGEVWEYWLGCAE